MLLFYFKLIADAKVLYGVDPQKFGTLATSTPALLKINQQKHRHGVEAEQLETVVSSHSRKMEETMDEALSQGQTNSADSCFTTLLRAT